MENFEELLKIELDKLPYEKHVDDGMYNDGQVDGFEQGARWAFRLFGAAKSLCPECGKEKNRLWRLCTDCSIKRDEE